MKINYKYESATSGGRRTVNVAFFPLNVKLIRLNHNKNRTVCGWGYLASPLACL